MIDNLLKVRTPSQKVGTPLFSTGYAASIHVFGEAYRLAWDNQTCDTLCCTLVRRTYVSVMLLYIYSLFISLRNVSKRDTLFDLDARVCTQEFEFAHKFF
jgi:hypothetical protein